MPIPPSLDSVTAIADARIANLVLGAEDAYQTAQDGSSAAIVEPPPDPRLSPDWTIVGLVTGQDALFRSTLDLGARRVFYGWVLQSTADRTQYLVVIRGTVTLTEWAIDGEFLPRVAHPCAGEVESGFWGLYQTFRLRTLDSADELPLVAALTAIVGTGSLIVAGHSLGAPLATFLTVDLADPKRLGNRVSGRFFASPRPGDDIFAQYADARIDYNAYAAPDDIVTHVPAGLGYANLPRTIELADPSGFCIERTPGCQHHLVSYLKRLNPAFDTSKLQPIDQPYLSCLKVLP